MNDYSALQGTLLLVDDCSADLEFMERCLGKIGITGRIVSFVSGSQAIEYLRGDGDYGDRDLFPYPSFVITDLNMPQGDGFSLLEYLQNDPERAIVPVLVLSNSNDDDDVRRAYRMGATSYMRKPQTLDQLHSSLRTFYDYWQLCSLPRVDATGRHVATESRGKLGERFGAVH